MQSDRAGYSQRVLRTENCNLHFQSINEEVFLGRIKESVKRDPHCVYIYYSGHSDENGNWMPDSETFVDLDKVLKTLGSFDKSVVIVIDCNFAGNWIK